MKFTKKTIYIGLFGLLYGIVAASSFWHAIAFFALANNSWMSAILAFAFEVGQAAVLFSLLTSKKDRSRVMPWVLMSMFTLVQVIGNVFSSYKYLINHSVANLRYFKEPIFIWMDLPDDQATVIITYIVGAILPITALLLTSMITNYLTDNEEEINNLSHNLSQNTEDNLINAQDVHKVESNLSEDTNEEVNKEYNEEYNEKDSEEVNKEYNKKNNKIDSKEDDIKPDIIENDQENKEVEEPKEKIILEDIPSEEALNKFEEIKNKRNNKTSHFINM